MKPSASHSPQLTIKSLLSRPISYPRTSVLFITISCIISLWPFSGAEDVANARQNILVGDRTDFWGGFSQFFYSAFQLEAPIWHITLGLVHAFLIYLGTVITMGTLRFIASPRRVLLLLFLHYLATIFTLHLSRDASLLAFLWVGVALLFISIKSTKFFYLLFSLGLTLVVVGLSFRPWLGITLLPLIFTFLYFAKSSLSRFSFAITLALASMFLVLGPLSLDTGAKTKMNLKQSYPEQQVMILDLASIVCLSPEKDSQMKALDALLPISRATGLDRERLCGQFYPQSWASLTFYSNPEDPALRMIGVGDSATYAAIRDSWINLISFKPIQYFQIKIFQVSQLFFAGDSVQLVPSSVKQALLIPYELLKALRILSFLPIILLFSWFTFARRFAAVDYFRKAILITYLLSIGMVTIAFIGDNQRYISWLALILSLCYLSAPRNKEKEVY